MLDLFEPPHVAPAGRLVSQMPDDETVAERKERLARERKAEQNRLYYARTREAKNARLRERYRRDDEYRAKRRAVALAFYHSLPEERKAERVARQRELRAAIAARQEGA
jgi:hypothetical protein